MFKYTLLIGIAVILLNGCSGASFSHKLKDSHDEKRVGIAFDNRNLDLIRVYPHTGDCINLDDPDNGFTNSAIGFQLMLNNKIENFPEIPETSVMRREFWVAAEKKITIRMFAGNGSYRTVTFKPVIGSYYYVTGLMIDPHFPRVLTVYEEFKTEKGYYDKRLVHDLGLKNCQDGFFRIQNF
ncbi:hypothetical protein [Sodalis sp. dw_96]|uniref:hypothetical protein n=1 Tax=Sodalis sp. dw_96 TaxID=2719794 RepID=UPI00210847A8|nr:hypothetical protein [Sodalis sp. dw_96]